MKKIVFAATFLAVFLVLNARAQIMEGAYNTMASPMDKVENSHAEYYADIPTAGAVEDAKSQDLRYEQATRPMNKAALRHINALKDYVPISERKYEETSGN